MQILGKTLTTAEKAVLLIGVLGSLAVLIELGVHLNGSQSALVSPPQPKSEPTEKRDMKGDVDAAGDPFFTGETLATVCLANSDQAAQVHLSAVQVRDETCEKKYQAEYQITDCKKGFDEVIADPSKAVVSP